MIVLVLYIAISYWSQRCKVDTAVRYKDNIFQSENVSAPFVLGIVKPRIYLLFKLDGQNLEHVVAHEQATEFEEFDDGLLRRLMEQITVHESGTFIVEFKSRTMVEVLKYPRISQTALQN